MSLIKKSFNALPYTIVVPKIVLSFVEYGLDCYRKNPEHRKNYRHTSRPRAAKRKAQENVAKVDKKRKDDPDSYDSDFINDESDMDEDISSDEEDVDEWAPGKDEN